MNEELLQPTPALKFPLKCPTCPKNFRKDVLKFNMHQKSDAKCRIAEKNGMWKCHQCKDNDVHSYILRSELLGHVNKFHGKKLAKERQGPEVNKTPALRGQEVKKGKDGGKKKSKK